MQKALTPNCFSYIINFLPDFFSPFPCLAKRVVNFKCRHLLEHFHSFDSISLALLIVWKSPKDMAILILFSFVIINPDHFCYLKMLFYCF